MSGSATTDPDRTCPGCGLVGRYWLTETSKECQGCGTTWVSAWALAHNDPKEPDA